MGAEELVGGCGEEVAPDGLDVEDTVGCIVHRIDEDQGTCSVGGIRHRRHVHNRPDGVGSMGHGDQTGTRRDRSRDGCRIQPTALRVEVHQTHDRPGFFGGGHPRRDVRVVIEAGADDLVARSPGAGKGPAEGQGDRRHVLPEGDLLGNGRVHQIGNGAPRRMLDLPRLFAGCERTAQVGTTPGEDGAHRIDDALRDLRAARTVRVHGREIADGSAQGGELAADGRDVEHGERA